MMIEDENEIAVTEEGDDDDEIDTVGECYIDYV